MTTTDRDDAIARLHELLKPGDTVWCAHKWQSRTGQHVETEFFKIDENWPIRLGRFIGDVLGLHYGTHEGLYSRDRAAGILAELSYTLWGSDNLELRWL
jgi:hypothetical protein